MVKFCTVILVACISSTVIARGTPPTLVVIPRQWKIPVNEMVGHPVAEIRVTHYGDGADVEYAVEPSQGNKLHGLNFSDASGYFSLHQRGPNALKVYLTKSLEEDFKAGDQLTLSLTARSKSGDTFTSRHEVFIEVEEPHVNPFAQIPTTAASTTTTTARPNSTDAPHTSASSTTIRTVIVMKGLGDEEQEGEGKKGGANKQEKRKGEEMEKQQTSQHLVLVLVPVLLVFPAAGLAVWYYRHCLRRACTKVLKRGGVKDAHNKDNDDVSMDDIKKEGGGARKISTSSIVSHGGVTSSPGAGEGVASRLYTATPTATPDGEMQLKQDSSPGDSDDRWEFPRHQMRFLSLIGEGCFGQVWKYEADGIIEHCNNHSQEHSSKGKSNGKSKDTTTMVAVKTLKNSATDKEKKDLLQELDIMKMLDPHPNVVRLLGCCTDKDPIFLILEFVDGGTLQDYLRKNRSQHNYRNLHGESSTLTARDLTSFAFQIAKGMSFLSSKKVIHRDLAARNVLIGDGDLVCKVADFGFARDVVDSNVYERKSEGRLPIRWMAPESLYDNCYTDRSDVWSFGVLMWEIVALGATPYPGKSASEVMKFVRSGGRPDKPPHCDRQLYNVMSYCWSASPQDRPPFSELVSDFERMLGEEADYIDLNAFPDHEYYNHASAGLSDERV